MMSRFYRLFRDYLRLGIFAVGLLVGVQVPGFVDQYEKRVNARLDEATQNLAGFKFTADRYFSGSIERLISHYKASEDVVFQQDAVSIQSIYSRVKLLRQEAQLLSGNQLSQAWHVLAKSNSQLLDETLESYSYSVLLNPFALVWGICGALILAILLDLFIGSTVYCTHKVTAKSFHRG